MLYFTHLAPSKCLQNNTVDAGDINLWKYIVNYYEYVPSFSWQSFKLAKLPQGWQFFPGIWCQNQSLYPLIVVQIS